MQLIAAARAYCFMIVQLGRAACKLDFLYYFRLGVTILYGFQMSLCPNIITMLDKADFNYVKQLTNL